METKTYSFSNIKFSDLEEIVQIKGKINDDKFREWFEHWVETSEDDKAFFMRLIGKNRLLLPSYSEEKLKMRFLALILDKVDFSTDTMQDWYDAALAGFVNGVEIKGFTDFMVATGSKSPHKPYFFIQEFKPTQADKDVEDQLLAEMLVAIELNQTTMIRGAYIIGQNWRFVIVEKINNTKFEYFVSKQFDSLDIMDLLQIYANLMTVKLKYCQE